MEILKFIYDNFWTTLCFLFVIFTGVAGIVAARRKN